MTDYTAKCPKCGSESIVGDDLVPCTSDISGWYRDEAGDLIPEWSGESKMCWDGQMPADAGKPYICTNCCTNLGDSELVLTEVVPDEEEA